MHPKIIYFIPLISHARKQKINCDPQLAFAQTADLSAPTNAQEPGE